MANVTPWTISNSFLQKVDPGISSPNVLHLLECRAFTGTPHRKSDSKGGILHMESDLPLHYTGDNVFHHKWNVMKIWPIMNWTLNSALISSLTCFILHQEKKSLNFVKWVRWVMKSNTKVFLDDFLSWRLLQFTNSAKVNLIEHAKKLTKIIKFPFTVNIHIWYLLY